MKSQIGSTKYFELVFLLSLTGLCIYYASFIIYPQPSMYINRSPVRNLISNISFPTIAFQPYLWHVGNYNRDSSEDRLFAQRGFMRYISENMDLVYQVKRILVLVKEGNMTGYPEGTSFSRSNKYNLSKICAFETITCNSEIANIENYDAVVSPENCIENLESYLWKDVTKVLPHVYMTVESPKSPYYPPVDLSINNKIFANYWANSDIVIPYGKWLPLQRREKAKAPLKNYAEGKTRMAAMVVSNCKSKNGRLEYAQALQQHLQLDIYGQCGNMSCQVDTCFKMLQKNYKFLLSFENANCREYISEKLFTNAYKYEIVPIVMGAHPNDYKTRTPPHSYIHVEDFHSPKELANYLKMLDENDTLYNEYFSWKETGQLVDTYSDFFCRVCAMIIYSDYVPQHKWSPGSSSKNENECLPDNRWYWESKRNNII